jgi:hypothetical protein
MGSLSLSLPLSVADVACARAVHVGVPLLSPAAQVFSRLRSALLLSVVLSMEVSVTVRVLTGLSSLSLSLSLSLLLLGRDLHTTA